MSKIPFWPLLYCVLCMCVFVCLLTLILIFEWELHSCGNSELCRAILQLVNQRRVIGFIFCPQHRKQLSKQELWSSAESFTEKDKFEIYRDLSFNLILALQICCNQCCACIILNQTSLLQYPEQWGFFLKYFYFINFFPHKRVNVFFFPH